jgi:hypothetical protein
VDETPTIPRLPHDPLLDRARQLLAESSDLLALVRKVIAQVQATVASIRTYRE